MISISLLYFLNGSLVLRIILLHTSFHTFTDRYGRWLITLLINKIEKVHIFLSLNYNTCKPLFRRVKRRSWSSFYSRKSPWWVKLLGWTNDRTNDRTSGMKSSILFCTKQSNPVGQFVEPSHGFLNQIRIEARKTAKIARVKIRGLHKHKQLRLETEKQFLHEKASKSPHEFFENVLTNWKKKPKKRRYSKAVRMFAVRASFYSNRS